MKRWLLIGGGVIVLGVIVVANLKRSSAPGVEARLSTVERADVTATITAPGRVRAVATVDLSAEVPGRVVELNVAEGDSVTRGDLLLRLDGTQYRSRVEQARASLAASRAGLNLAQAGMDKLDLDRTRIEALHARDLASQERLDNVLAEHRIQAATVESRRQDVERARAALEEAEDSLEKTVYRAPVTGIVSRLNIDIGENVVIGTMNNPGTVILTLADLSRMEVEAEVDETDVVEVGVGQPAEITVDALPDTVFAGTVTSVGHSGRRLGAGMDVVIHFEVIVAFDRPDPRLRPGMTADIEVRTRTRNDVLTVPIQALVARSRGALARERQKAARLRGGRPPESPADTLHGDARREWERRILEGVYLVEDGEAVFVEVTPGVADRTRIEVSGALEEGARVVSGPFQVLRDLEEGTRVEAESESAEESG